MKNNSVHIIGKTSNCCRILITNKDGTIIGSGGYPPRFITDNNYGSEHISIEFDMETGQILDWDRRKEQLKEFIERQVANW